MTLAIWLGSVIFIVYSWAVYPLLLTLLTFFHSRRVMGVRHYTGKPFVSIVLTVHNEDRVIRERIRNCLDLTYPADRLEVFVVSDHSTDRTEEMIRSFFDDPRVEMLRAEQRGKSLAQNEAVSRVKGDVVIFTDADTSFLADFVEQIVKGFEDPEVGCVSGKLVWTNPGESAVAEGGNTYWRYEHFLWRMESQLGILAWASGACMAVRRRLFKPMEPQYGEDCVVPLDVVGQGYKVVFQPDAVGLEERIADAKAELRTRARMTLRSFTGTLGRKQLLNPFRYPGVAWAIFSHKILRWVTPYFLLGVFVSNLFLLSHPFFRLTLTSQLAFYVVGLIGYLTDKRGLKLPLVSAIYSFCLANLAMFWGVTKGFLSYRIVTYPSER